MKKYFVIFTLILVQGCSSGGDSAPSAAVEVDLLGTWNRDSMYTNSVCSGLVAKGIITVQSLNGDITKIGDILYQGELFDIDKFGNCTFINVDQVQTNWSGRPAVQTVDEFLAFTIADNLGDSTVQSVRYDSFTSTKIVEVTTYTNTVVQTDILSRIP